jgi:hydroxyethylthiazole kinase-like sugar kinase family protein
VTVLESKEREKGSNNDSESSSETEAKAGMEAETEAEMAFSCIGTVFSVKRTGDSVFLWEGGITVFNGITGTGRLCNEGPGQDDEA